MSTLLTVSSSRRGYVLVSLLVSTALIVAGVWALRARPPTRFVEATTQPAGKPEAGSGADNSGIEIMLGLASSAVAEQRLVAPAGSNAYEFYLSVLQLDPQNRVAQETLHELFPRASADLEAAINQQQLDEAQREIGLLREVDHDDYTLALLAGKLDAQRRLLTREHEARAAILQAAAITAP